MGGIMVSRLNTLAGGQAPRTMCLILSSMDEEEMSQYPRWWAGSSDVVLGALAVAVGYGLNTLAGGQAPRTSVVMISHNDILKSQYPRWWAGSSDLHPNLRVV